MEISKRQLQENYNPSDVDFVFNTNPKLSEIGTKEEYSQYLSTIFPSSKVQDIVFHRTKSKVSFEKFDLSFAKDFGDYGKAFYFAPLEKVENVWNKNALSNPTDKILAVKLNINNPFIDSKDRYSKDYQDFIEKNPNNGTVDYVEIHNDGVIDYYDENSTNYQGSIPLQYAVYDSNNIHILGSKQDIEGFRNFVNNTDMEITKRQLQENLNNVIYTAVFFNTNEVVSKYKQIHPNLYSHHSTIEFKPTDISNLPIGEEINIKVIGRLTNDKVDVLLVKNPLSKNKFPHITLSTAEGIKPFQSNTEIENNQDKIKPINDNLIGIVGYFDGSEKTQLEGMEVSKKELIQNKKLKEDAEDVNFMGEITKGELEEAKKFLIKESYDSNDINDIFKQNPQLGLIGTQKEYAKYLNTLFPSSKYKDIYYHKSKEMFDVYDFSKRKAYSSDLGKYLYLSGNKGKWEKYASMHRGTSFSSPVSTLYFKVNLINPHITKDFFGEKIEYDNSYDGEEGQMDGEEFQNYVRSTNDGIVEVRDRDDLYNIIPKYIYQMAVFDSKNYLRLGSKQDTINFQKFLGKNKYSENEIEKLIKQYNPNLNTGKIFMDNFEGDIFHKAMDTKEQLDNDPNLKSKIFTILGLTNNDDEKAKRKGIEIYAKYLLAYPKGDLNGFKNFIKSNHEYLDTPSIVDAEWNTQFEGMEITKRQLEEAKKKKADRCLRIARRKMPQTSAYRSGNVVRCRQGKIWKGLNEEEELDIQEPEYALIEITKALAYMDDKYRYQLIPKSKLNNRLIDIKKGASGYKSISPNNLKVIETGNKSELETKLKELQNKSLDEKWSEKYKRSIDCNNPKGFSQKAHCKGRLKESKELFQNKALDKLSKVGGFELLSDIDKLALLGGSNDERLKYLDLGNIFKQNGGTFGKLEIKVKIKDKNLQPIKHKFSQEFAGKEGYLFPYINYSDENQEYVIVRFDEFVTNPNNFGGGNYEERPIMLANLYPIDYDKIKSDFVDYQNKTDFERDEFMKSFGFDDDLFEPLNEKTDFSKEKEQGLHGWFARQGGKGKSKGWVDCNTCRTVDGKKKCKTCGRQKGEKRAKYPACRPTPSACKTKGKGKSWGKKSANEDVLNEQSKQDIERELKLNEIKSLFQRHIGKL